MRLYYRLKNEAQSPEILEAASLEILIIFLFEVA